MAGSELMVAAERWWKFGGGCEVVAELKLRDGRGGGRSSKGREGDEAKGDERGREAPAVAVVVGIPWAERETEQREMREGGKLWGLW